MRDTTEIFMVRVRKDTHEIIGVLTYTNPADAAASAAEDSVYDHKPLTNDQFHHLQGSPGFEGYCTKTDPTCHLGQHRYEGNALVAKSKLVLTADKYNITVNTDTATISWAVGKPILLTVNGHLISAPVQNSLPIKASFSGQYRIQVSDPQFYSDELTINAEEPVSA